MPAARPVAQYPIDVLGSYAISATSGTIAAGQGANSPIFSFRWTDTVNAALIHRVAISMMSLGTGFAVGAATFGIIAARAFTGSDTGGTPLTLTTNNGKRKTGFSTTLVGDMRIASTAALGAGTRTLDAQDFGLLQCGITASVNTVFQPTTNLWAPDQSSAWPLELVTNEGFVVRATVPATGTWQAQVTVEWSETAPAAF
jgi:hypothetical protein